MRRVSCFRLRTRVKSGRAKLANSERSLSARRRSRWPASNSPFWACWRWPGWASMKRRSVTERLASGNTPRSTPSRMSESRFMASFELRTWPFWRMPKARPILSKSLPESASRRRARAFSSCSMIDCRTPESRLRICVLGLAEGRLVRDLEDAAARVGALAEEAAHDHAELVHGADDLLHLVRDDERGQVHHGGGAHAGAEVRRAGGQVAEARREGEVEALLERRVQLVDRGPGLLQLEARRAAPGSGGGPPR